MYLYTPTISLVNNIHTKRVISMGNKYIENVYKEYVILGVTCERADRNNDGYKTCDFGLSKNATEKEINLQLQCPTLIKSFVKNECYKELINIH